MSIEAANSSATCWAEEFIGLKKAAAAYTHNLFLPEVIGHVRLLPQRGALISHLPEQHGRLEQSSLQFSPASIHFQLCLAVNRPLNGLEGL